MALSSNILSNNIKNNLIGFSFDSVGGINYLSNYIDNISAGIVEYTLANVTAVNGTGSSHIHTQWNAIAGCKNILFTKVGNIGFSLGSVGGITYETIFLTSLGNSYENWIKTGITTSGNGASSHTHTINSIDSALDLKNLIISNLNNFSTNNVGGFGYFTSFLDAITIGIRSHIIGAQLSTVNSSIHTYV